MGKLLENVTECAIVGGMIGGAVDALTIGGATLLAGPAGFAAAATAIGRKEALGVIIGAGFGIAKTVKEDIEGENKQKVLSDPESTTISN